MKPVAWRALRSSAAGFVKFYFVFLSISPGFAVNMSLGLTMKSDQRAQNTVVCGPTIAKDCKSITMYNGVCFQLDRYNRLGPPVPSSIQGNSKRSLINCKTKQSLEIRFFFLFARNNVFTPQRGSRPNGKKVLIVITDGQSTDRYDLRDATKRAESKNIVRFAIGVGSAFRLPDARKELRTIASTPSYVFEVENFDALEVIRQNLQDKIFSIEGMNMNLLFQLKIPVNVSKIQIITLFGIYNLNKILCIYICTQRITGSEVQSGLKFFGLTISQSSFDHSGDRLPDLAVGSKGRVVLLRSRPIVMVKAEVLFSPNQIPTQNVDCSKPLENTAAICFTMSRVSTVNAAQARIDYTLTLDASRKSPTNRAYVSGKQQEQSGSVTLDLRNRQCSTVKFIIEACPEDALNVLSNELKFIFDGLPLNTNLRPSLAPQSQTATIFPLGFEINCGTDNRCVDNLKVDFGFTRSSVVKVGIDEFLHVTVTVENGGENSYNSHVILTYPAGLSYRKFTSQQGRIECNSLDSEDDLSRGWTDCTIDKPIFKSKTKASFIVSYGIDTNSQFEKEIFITANATSGNQEHAPTSELYKRKSINVKYSIFMTFASSLSYNNFTFGKNDLKKPVQQSVKVSNDIRALNFIVVIKVPVKLGEKDIWVDLSSLQISDCQRGNDEEPSVRDFVPKIQKNKVVDCSVARCRVFKCNSFLKRLQSRTYEISANISSQWIEQIGLQSTKFLLTSTATVEYDQSQYIYFSTVSNNNPPVHKLEAVVEVYSEANFTKEIIGGCLGGLAFLALLTAGLYKAGFFESKYKQMINDNAEDGPDPGTDGSPSPAEK
uniref:Integrin alpha-X-like n=1 Tax=Pundamilia nyererei TaxID=303518 RepID=A0A3B4EVJ8_9CICH